MNHLEVKYLELLSRRLRNFRKKDSSSFNFSCPICGDSKKHKYKARGYVYFIHGKAFYRCYNCDVSITFSNFLKAVDNDLYSRYSMEAFRDKDRLRPSVQKVHVPIYPAWKNSLIISLDHLTNDHPAISYCLERKIPLERMKQLFYTPDFAAWVNSVRTDGKYSEMVKDERLVIPILSRSGELLGAIGRALDKNAKVRYLSPRLTDDVPMNAFGIDRWSPKELTYIVEGAIDSMFLPNCVAALCTDLIGTASFLMSEYGMRKENCVLIYDNEPRNEHVVKLVSRAAKSGLALCIWPDENIGKDINEMVLRGIDVLKLVSSRTYHDLEAVLMVSTWRCC